MESLLSRLPQSLLALTLSALSVADHASARRCAHFVHATADLPAAAPKYASVAHEHLAAFCSGRGSPSVERLDVRLYNRSSWQHVEKITQLQKWRHAARLQTLRLYGCLVSVEEVVAKLVPHMPTLELLVMRDDSDMGSGGSDTADINERDDEAGGGDTAADISERGDEAGGGEAGGGEAGGDDGDAIILNGSTLAVHATRMRNGNHRNVRMRTERKQVPMFPTAAPILEFKAALDRGFKALADHTSMRYLALDELLLCDSAHLPLTLETLRVANHLSCVALINDRDGDDDDDGDGDGAGPEYERAMEMDERHVVEWTHRLAATRNLTHLEVHKSSYNIAFWLHDLATRAAPKLRRLRLPVCETPRAPPPFAALETLECAFAESNGVSRAFVAQTALQNVAAIASLRTFYHRGADWGSDGQVGRDGRLRGYGYLAPRPNADSSSSVVASSLTALRGVAVTDEVALDALCVAMPHLRELELAADSVATFAPLAKLVGLTRLDLVAWRRVARATRNKTFDDDGDDFENNAISSATRAAWPLLPALRRLDLARPARSADAWYLESARQAELRYPHALVQTTAVRARTARKNE
jgi:hypothetical protein